MSAEVRSAGSQVPRFCSQRAVSIRALSVGACRNVTTIAVEITATTRPTSVITTTSSISVIPASRDRPVRARSDVTLDHLHGPLQSVVRTGDRDLHALYEIGLEARGRTRAVDPGAA